MTQGGSASHTRVREEMTSGEREPERVGVVLANSVRERV